MGGILPDKFELPLPVSMLLTSPEKNNVARNAMQIAIALTAAMDVNLCNTSRLAFPFFIYLVYRK